MWVEVPDYPLYEINLEGQVRNAKTKRLRTPRAGKYIPVNTTGQSGQFHIAKMMVRVFLGVDVHWTLIRYKDGDPTNVAMSNLIVLDHPTCKRGHPMIGFNQLVTGDTRACRACNYSHTPHTTETADELAERFTNQEEYYG